MRRQMHSDDTVGAHLPQGFSGNGIAQKAIHVEFAVKTHGKKHSWISAARAHGIDQRAGFEDHALSRSKLGGGDGQRNAQLLKGVHPEEPIEKPLHAVIGAEAEAGDGPAGKVLKAHQHGNFFHLFGAQSAAVCGTNHRTDTGSSDVINRDALLLKDLEHADVRHAAGESATHGQPNAGPLRKWSRRRAMGVARIGKLIFESFHRAHNFGKLAHTVSSSLTEMLKGAVLDAELTIINVLIMLPEFGQPFANMVLS